MKGAPHDPVDTVVAVAIDSATGIEVSVVGPAKALQSDLENLAMRKLLRALEKHEKAAGGTGGFNV